MCAKEFSDSIIFGKQYIYKRKCSNAKPFFLGFKGIIDFMFQIEIVYLLKRKLIIITKMRFIFEVKRNK